MIQQARGKKSTKKKPYSFLSVVVYCARTRCFNIAFSLSVCRLPHQRNGKRKWRNTRSPRPLKILAKAKNAFVLAITDFRSFSDFGRPEELAKALVIARLNRDKCWIEEGAKTSSVSLRFSPLYLQPRFPRLFTSGKKPSDHGTRTGKKWVNYRDLPREIARNLERHDYPLHFSPYRAVFVSQKIIWGYSICVRLICRKHK